MSSGVASKAYNASFGPHMVPVTRAGEEFAGTLTDREMGKAPGTKTGNVWWPKAIESCQCSTVAMALEWDRWGANVGIATGREAQLVAIDVDFDDPGAAHIANTILRTHFKIYRGVDTPGHHRFMYPMRIKGNMPKGTTLKYEKNGVKIMLEILGEGRQFVAWGIHAKKLVPYTWSVDITEFVDGVYEFPEITLEQFLQIIDEVLTALTDAGWVKTSGSVTGNNAVTGTVERRTCTEYELARWLALIPNTDTDNQFDDRAAWVGMAHAIKGASDGAAWGYEMWLAWCNQRQQVPGEPEKVWDSLKDDGRLGLDYIRGKAAERNAKLAAQLDFEFAPPPDPEQIAQLVADADENSVWPPILSRFVFIKGQDKFFDLVTGESMTYRGFDMTLGAVADRMKNDAFPDDKTVRLPSQMFAKHSDAQKLDNFTYWPGQPRLCNEPKGRRYLVNTWRASSYLHRPGVSENDIRPWIDLVELICNDKAAAKKLIKFFALIVKRPGEKANHHPLIMTRQGLGKDTMLLPVIHAVGTGNSREVTADDQAEKWTDWAEHRFCYVSETRHHSRGNKSAHDVMNDLKPFLVDKPEFVGVLKKQKGKYLVPNLSMWVFFSNESHPLYLAEGDRRIWVIKNLDTMPPPPDYYEKLQAWLAKNIDLVASYLMDYPLTAADIAEFKGAAPMNAAKRDLIAANRDPVEVVVGEIVADAKLGAVFGSLLVTMEDFRAEVMKREPTTRVSNQIIAKHLRKVGARPAAVGADGSSACTHIPGIGPKRLWLLADTDAAGHDYAKLSPTEIAQLWLSKKWPTPQYPTGNGTVLTAINGKDEI
jgi:hypothetical protein